MNLLRSEWTKFRSLRSTWLTAAVTVVLGVGISALASGGKAAEYTGEDWDPTAISLTSIIMAQLAIGVLGVLVITSEYATGTIHPTVTAAPRRAHLLTAKATVLATVAVLLGQLIGFTCFLVGQAIIAAANVPSATLGQPEVLRAVVGSGLYLAAIGLLGLALGTIFRTTAGAIGALVSLTLLVRLVAQALPANLGDWVSRYWPTAAGEKIVAVLPNPDALPPWPGFALLCAFVAALGAAGYAVLNIKDA